MRIQRVLAIAVASGTLCGIALPAARALSVPAPIDASPAARDTEPVVLTGASLPQWSAPSEVTVKAPMPPSTDPNQKLCSDGSNTCSHNQYEKPEVDSSTVVPSTGVDVHKLLGYRWDDRHHRFVQIPFQVDEFAVRYISNNASTFSLYSWTDQNLTPVFDQERFRWTKSDPADPCKAVADGPPTTPDNVAGLDDNDELSFQASDAGPAAPDSEPMPKHISGSYRITVTDPLQGGAQSYVYVMLADSSAKAPQPAYTAANGYVRYLPDADSDTFLYSQSSYGSYGNVAKGPFFDPATNTCVADQAKWKQHRPKDTAWIKTPTYSFRYDGRWLMTEQHVVDPKVKNRLDDDPSTWQYGPDLIDQWKARAFQQRPGGETPCCGYEEEVNNWGGSSILMGVRSGPVRTLRSTWGADSSTNNVRTEVFYRDEMHQLDNLRVHVIPPGDGIYSQWDFNAGRMATYYNPYVPNGVAIDGQNDEVFGNAQVKVASDGIKYQSDDKTGVEPVDQAINAGVSVGSTGPGCPSGQKCINNDIDIVDPTVSGPHGALSYEETTGPFGTFVDRYAVKQVTAGTAYTLVTLPYYRDDSCFDDGTGSDPGPHLAPRKPDSYTAPDGTARHCWRSGIDPLPIAGGSNEQYFQGDIGTHGVHIELIADSDNAATTEPIDEIDSDLRRVVLPGARGNVGEQYGRGTEKPLVGTAVLESRTATPDGGHGNGNGNGAG